jgi:hypothetical protein
MSLTEAELERQRRSNVNALRYSEAFENHRRHLTEVVAPGPRSESAATGSLCVLGAGNACDLDLERLSWSHGAIHLVDIDREALERAYSRQSPRVRSQLVLHAPVDLSGVLGRLARWRSLQVSAEELLHTPELASASLASKIGTRFDVVLSACLLSQMHLSVRQALGEGHPLFEAVAYTLTLVHLRTLSRLAHPGGRVVLATDVATEAMAPLRALPAGTDLGLLLDQLIDDGHVFGVVNPRALEQIAADDPHLARELASPRIRDTWLWHNGPERIFLVCALELERTAAS